MNKRRTKAADCAHCLNDKPFVIPEHLLERIRNEEVVLFAGAGISTENKQHCGSTFYEEVCAELGISDRPAFPALMTSSCARPDGRIKLLQKIKQRFEYFTAFSDFYYFMTRFHRAISPLFMIKDVITTNWDDFFERECMLDAFVYDRDLAFWDSTPRRLMKIHGSIANPGSIVATSEDYLKSFRRLNDGPLGAHLKSLIARKTVIYTGYSLSDENYLRLLRNISKMMGPNLRHSYFVAPNIDKARLASAPIPLIPIETDGAHFFEHVRTQLAERVGIIKDEAFEFCEDFLSTAAKEHNKTASIYLRVQHPLLFFALSYQDGLIHALKRISNRRKAGEYHSKCRIVARIHTYESRLADLAARKDFWNAAYALGYQAGIMLLLAADEEKNCPTPPLIDFPFAINAHSMTSVLRYPRNKLPKAAITQINKMQRKHPGIGKHLVPDHTPYL